MASLCDSAMVRTDPPNSYELGLWMASLRDSAMVRTDPPTLTSWAYGVWSLRESDCQRTGEASSPTYFQDSNLEGVNLHFPQVYFRNAFNELAGKRWFRGLDMFFPDREAGAQKAGKSNWLLLDRWVERAGRRVQLPVQP